MIELDKAHELVKKFWKTADIEKYSNKILESFEPEVWYLMLIGCPEKIEEEEPGGE